MDTSGRIWQRGASKGRKGSQNRRMMNDIYAGDFGSTQDTMMSALQKSLIAETLQGARAHVGSNGKASLNEPSRPFTPGDMPRHLFHGNDYSNRPGSSYKMNNVIGQAADEFIQYSGVKTQANTNYDSSQKSIGGSAHEDVLSIIERHQPKVGGLPNKLNSKNLPQLRSVIPGQVLPSISPSDFQKQKASARRAQYAEQNMNSTDDSGTLKQPVSGSSVGKPPIR